MSRVAAFHFLCGCLSRNLVGSQEALLHSAQNPAFAWETFVQVAGEALVAPAVLDALRSKNLVKAFPSDVIDFFDGVATLNRQRNERLVSEAIALAAILNEIEVLPVFLKGGAHLLSGLYPDLALRLALDLDVLVPADRLSNCVSRLSAYGYKELLTNWDFSGHHHCPPLGRQGSIAAVELHSEPLDPPHRQLLPAGDVLRDVVVLQRGTVKLSVPSARCRMVQAVAHAQLADQAYIFGQLPVREFIDYARLHEAFAREIDWSEFVERFAACGFATALEFHLLAADRLFGVPIAPPIRISATASGLYRRALWQVGHPRWSRLGIRLLRPWVLLRHSLSDSVLRRRLLRNLGNWTWYRRQWRIFRQ
jgi:Uncharacterised nucleotidyltransferase